MNHKDCPCNECKKDFSQDNGDWEVLFVAKVLTFAKTSHAGQDASHLTQELKDKLRSQRQSDKELILGKMEEKKKGCEFDSTEGVCEYCLSVDTCKSIVEEVMK